MHRQIQPPPLTIGLIVDSEFDSKYVYQLAEWGQKQSGLRISHLVIQNTTTPGYIRKAVGSFKRHRLKYLPAQVLFQLLVYIENFYLKAYKHHCDHLKHYDLRTVVSESITIKPQISKSGYVYRFTDDDIDRVKSLNLDILVRCGSGILFGEILNSAKFGIISFHHADNRINRGSPAGFWEVYFKQDTTGFTIQSLTEELDGGAVISRGRFWTRFFFLLNQAALYAKSNFHMMKVLTELASTRSLVFMEETQPYFNPLFKKPSCARQIVYAIDVARRLAVKITRRLLKVHYRWNVAFVRRDWKNLVMWRSNKIESLPDGFIADPFLIRERGRDYCFVEDYKFDKKRGCIAVYELGERTAHRIGNAVVEPFHMSFPFLFRYEEALYMCPETCEAGDIRLYECVEFPQRWQLSRVLMNNVSAADSMIFERDGLWWLFTNIDPANIGDHCSELFIFCSDSPLSNTWRAHKKNPVLVDSLKGRNAGLIFQDGEICRVAQRQGFDMYGKGFSINKISVLSEEEYCEDELCSVEANFFPHSIGTHHLTSNCGVTVFDYLEIT